VTEMFTGFVLGIVGGIVAVGGVATSYLWWTTPAEWFEDGPL